MKTIWSERWIFGRVRRDLSPNGVPGFQTLWTGGGLPKAIVNELETIASGFVGVSQTSRFQFFHLSDGRVAFTSIRPSADVQTVDRSGRSAFLCFGWILELRDFKKLHNDPFRAFPPTKDLPDVPALLEELGEPGSTIEPALIPMRPPRTPTPELPRQTLDLLTTAALRASRTGRSKRPITLLGSPDDCVDVLSWTLNHIPPSDRIACTFSTQTDHCSIPNGLFWVTGRTLREGQRSLIEVTIPSGTVCGEIPEETQSPRSLRFHRWLAAQPKERNPSDDELDDIDMVLRALDGESVAGVNQIHKKQFVTEFLCLHQQDVIEALARSCSSMLPRRSARKVADSLWAESDPSNVDLVLDMLLQGAGRIDVGKLRAILEVGWSDLPIPLRWLAKLRFDISRSRLLGRRRAEARNSNDFQEELGK